MEQDTDETGDGDSLQAQLLIAMPSMQDERFQRSVIFMCSHTAAAGAMGLMINKQLPNLQFADLAKQLDIEAENSPPITMHFGGPVETGRGFVLHSDDYQREATIPMADGVSMTATVDILRAMASGAGPGDAILALGYAGWAPGQLEQEIQRNDWLHCAADSDIIFGVALDAKWEAAVRRIGIDPAMLSMQAGRA
ncbi:MULTISPECIES: YqgE/AlgH family protein [unclassified Minwuia]|jgi:putative transcriptional regulator|uniref:YqgE/AlgH family protein n=1 Tax=unclassified Minwuia TaxID=2618799 RepID=UPI0024797874|nr:MULTISPECIES: YqgE/AlgH family protein [unclassified Minwuia]